MAKADVEDKLNKSLDAIIKEDGHFHRRGGGRGGGGRGGRRGGGGRGRGFHGDDRRQFDGSNIKISLQHGGRGSGGDKGVRLQYRWGADRATGEEKLVVQCIRVEIVEIFSGGSVILRAGGFRNSMTKLGMNTALAPLGMQIEEGEASEEGGEKPWYIAKGTWKQEFTEEMKVSAFALREWPILRESLQALPTYVDWASVPQPSVAPVLGKRQFAPAPPPHFEFHPHPPMPMGGPPPHPGMHAPPPFIRGGRGGFRGGFRGRGSNKIFRGAP